MWRDQKKFLDFAPSIVVEILSPSTALKDRNTKYQIYEQEKVKYYVIVDIDTESIEIYQLTDEKYGLLNFNSNFTFELPDDCSINVQLANIFR
ncbi:Uma2 family endonuclease [Niabella ginsengisoli]|uniref:Uma2 family endonuclease n=1 Tax=Niabella ginsengisoli TaxID=522298 RepID=UPI0021D3FDA7|nr:Uma2 family endonuclease [Niabella ginsengisoli]